MTNTEHIYKYAVSEEGNRKFIEVEMAGRFELRKDESPAEKAKALIVSTQQVPEDSVKVEKVDGFSDGVITSTKTPKKR
jgi:hypothetical protein